MFHYIRVNILGQILNLHFVEMEISLHLWFKRTFHFDVLGDIYRLEPKNINNNKNTGNNV